MNSILIPYQHHHFNWLAQWVTSADLLFQFAGTDFTYLLTVAQLNKYQELHPDRHFYVAVDANDNPYAFGEIIPQANNTPRLGRILVGDPNKRGKGLGKVFMQLLVNECKRVYNCLNVELYVAANNIQAIKCYEKVGFRFLDTNDKLVEHGGKKHLIKQMSIHC